MDATIKWGDISTGSFKTLAEVGMPVRFEDGEMLRRVEDTEPFRGTYIVPIDRGLSSLRITFTVSRTHASLLAARQYVLTHPKEIAIASYTAPALRIDYSGLTPGTLHYTNAVLERVTWRAPGVTTFWTYSFRASDIA